MVGSDWTICWGALVSRWFLAGLWQVSGRFLLFPFSSYPWLRFVLRPYSLLSVKKKNLRNNPPTLREGEGGYAKIGTWGDLLEIS